GVCGTLLADSRADANEPAFKIARQYHQRHGDSGRHKFVSRYRAYHGNSMAALAATGQALRKYRYEPVAQGFLHVSPPDMYRSPYKGTEEEQAIAFADAIDRDMTWEKSEPIEGGILRARSNG